MDERLRPAPGRPTVRAPGRPTVTVQAEGPLTGHANTAALPALDSTRSISLAEPSGIRFARRLSLSATDGLGLSRPSDRDLASLRVVFAAGPAKCKVRVTVAGPGFD